MGYELTDIKDPLTQKEKRMQRHRDKMTTVMHYLVEGFNIKSAEHHKFRLYIKFAWGEYYSWIDRRNTDFRLAIACVVDAFVSSLREKGWNIKAEFKTTWFGLGSGYLKITDLSPPTIAV